jgi:hypothetical protein
MNPIRRLRRLAGVLAGLACAWLGLAAFAPAAFAMEVPPPGGPGGIASPPEPPGWNKHPPLSAQVHTVVVGGMPGWQIALIAVGAALAAAIIAVLADHAWAARRHAAAAGSAA